MEAAVVVSHTDDCILFAWPLVSTHPWKWRIIYTVTDNSARKREAEKFWKMYNVPTTFIKGKDRMDVTPKFTYQKHIWPLVKDCDVIVTHNEFGEYGHPHHIYTHKQVSLSDIPVIYFGPYNSSTLTDRPTSWNKKIYCDSFDKKHWEYHTKVMGNTFDEQDGWDCAGKVGYYQVPENIASWIQN